MNFSLSKTLTFLSYAFMGALAASCIAGIIYLEYPDFNTIRIFPSFIYETITSKEFWGIIGGLSIFGGFLYLILMRLDKEERERASTINVGDDVKIYAGKFQYPGKVVEIDKDGKFITQIKVGHNYITPVKNKK